MATHSSILAWRIPWTEEPGGLQSMTEHTRTRMCVRLIKRELIRTPLSQRQHVGDSVEERWDGAGVRGSLLDQVECV